VKEKCINCKRYINNCICDEEQSNLINIWEKFKNERKNGKEMS